MGYFTLLLSYFFGAVLISQLKIKFLPSTVPFYNILTGSVVFSILVYLFSNLTGLYCAIIISHIIMLVSLVISLVRYKQRFLKTLALTPILKDAWLISILVILLPLLLIIFNNHIIPNIDGQLYVGDSAYSDLAFHLASISQLAYSQTFPPQNPVYTGITLTYPYLINLFSAVLVVEGFSLRDSIMIPGIIFSLSIISAILDLSFALTRKKSVGFLVVLLFFFNGGLGFYYFLQNSQFDLSTIYTSLLSPQSLPEYSHFDSQNIHWGSFLSRILVPERSVLFGIPIGILILRLLFVREEILLSKFELFFVSFLMGFLALIHVHTVIAFSILIPLLRIYQLIKNYSVRLFYQNLLIVIITVAFASSLFTLFLNHLNESKSFFAFHYGWLKKPEEYLIWFWFKNSYLYIPLALCALLVPRLVEAKMKLLIIGAFLVLTVLNLIQFSPYLWDNIKLLFWVGLFLIVASAAILNRLFSTRNFPVIIFTAVVFLIMISSGLLSYFREINIQHVLFSKSALEVGSFIKSSTPKNSILLTERVHNSPASNLAGRQILLGSESLLWTQGVDYSNRAAQLSEVIGGSGLADSVIKNLNISYALFSKYSAINYEYFQKYPLVFENSEYVIYQTKY